MSAALPPARTSAAYRIAVVCLGNICRSPMADVVLRARIDDVGLSDHVTVLSAGTGDWHVGDPMDRRAAGLLTSSGYDASHHRAQQVQSSWLETCDLVLAMDDDNLEGLRSLGPADPARVRLFRDFDPAGRGDVPDPYYGGETGFLEVLDIVERTSLAIASGLGVIVHQ